MSNEDRGKSPAGDVPGPPSGAGAGPGDGVDVTLIRWFLGLTPSERLDALQRNVDALIELRRGRAGS
jgi:hypothetical protein